MKDFHAKQRRKELRKAQGLPTFPEVIFEALAFVLLVAVIFGLWITLKAL